jgi:enoyl-CoA hydratase
VNLVEYRPAGDVGFIVLNNPVKLNALNPEMLAGIGAALDTFLADDQARVADIRGEGPSFCAGVDVGHGSRYGTAAGPEDHERLRGMAALWLRFWDSPKPVIAQIHGYCLAGALQLPLCCDIVVVAEDAVIGAPKLPMGAGWIGPMLAHRVGAQRAKLFAFQIGFEMNGREAYEMGFAAMVTPPASLDAETEALARRIAAMPADLLRLEKLSINSVAEAAGFRSATYTGTLWDAIAHTSAGVAEAKALVRSDGVKAAVAIYARSNRPTGKA